MGRRSRERAAVEALARTHGPAAWRLALVAGADEAGASRAALHAVVDAADRAATAEPAVLAVARTSARSDPGAGRRLPVTGGEPVATAFWSLPEPLRTALWCIEVLRLPAGEVGQVGGPAVAAAAAVARGRVRRRVCRERRAVAAGSWCGATAAVLAKVLAGHAPATKVRLVDDHAAVCSECARLIEALRHPGVATAATLPPAPDLVVAAGHAWRQHVDARRLPPGRATLDLMVRHHRPVAAALALATAGTLGAATSQLAVATDTPSSPGWFGTPVLRLVRPAPPPPAPVPRQVTIAPLADGVLVDSRLAPHVPRDLAEVAPVAAPVPPSTVAPSPPPPPAPVLPAPAFGEPPPAVDRSTTVSLSLPLALPLPVGVEIGPTCSSITVGPVRLVLPCRR